MNWQQHIKEEYCYNANVISIYDEYDELVFSRKFMIYENVVSAGLQVKRSRNVKNIDRVQTVDIEISGGLRLNNPDQTINVLLIQNRNLNTAITDLKPQYTIGDKLIYRYVDESAFYGGNEYRFFETKDLRTPVMGVQFMELKDIYHSYLFIDQPRFGQPYTYNPDINGNFLITALDVSKPYIEADYAWIHFSLLGNDYLKDKTVHIYGNFNNYVIDENCLHD